MGRRNPPVYPVGCAGRITQFTETDDGRFLITLTGVSRFRIVEELPLLSGYRRVMPDWKPFDARPRDPRAPRFDRARLVRGLKSFFGQRQLSADWSAIEKAPAEQLIASIAMACPFAPSEKQALLEAADLEQRAELLTGLVEMAAIQPHRRGRRRHPALTTMRDRGEDGDGNPTDIDPKLLEILVCPLTKAPLRYDRAAQELISEEAGLAYPIRDGIPIMLVDEARPLRPRGEGDGKRLPPPAVAAMT